MGTGNAPTQPSPALGEKPVPSQKPGGHLAGEGALVASPLALSWWSRG